MHAWHAPWHDDDDMQQLRLDKVPTLVLLAPLYCPGS